MDLAAELNGLAELHRSGHLSDNEFLAAKRRLLGEPAAAPATPAVLDAPPPEMLGKRRTFRSSRWSSGNLFFPDRITIGADGLHFRKGALFGSQEEHIPYHAIASLRVDHGIFLSNLNIETSGGTQPIFLNGLWKSDARAIQSAVEAHGAAVMRR